MESTSCCFSHGVGGAWPKRAYVSAKRHQAASGGCLHPIPPHFTPPSRRRACGQTSATPYPVFSIQNQIWSLPDAVVHWTSSPPEASHLQSPQHAQPLMLIVSHVLSPQEEEQSPLPPYPVDDLNDKLSSSLSAHQPPSWPKILFCELTSLDFPSTMSAAVGQAILIIRPIQKMRPYGRWFMLGMMVWSH